MSAVAGVGTDLLRAGTIALSVAAPYGPFVQKAHTAAERAHIQSRDIPLYSYAIRFVNKKAAFKSSGGHGGGV